MYYMTLEDNLDIFFNMALSMAKSRGGSPKYIVRKEPVLGKPLEIFECMPLKGGGTEYSTTGNLIPNEVIRGKGECLSYYFLRSTDCQLVVCYLEA